LGRGEVCVRLTRDGQPSEAFIGRTGNTDSVYYGRHTAVVEQSRRQHGRSRNLVEDKIRRWLKGPRTV
jgi:hypothetical protein